MLANKTADASASRTEITFFDVAPEHAAVVRKLSELCDRESKLLAEMNEITAHVHRRAARQQTSVPPYFFQRRRAGAPPVVVEVTPKAKALLGELAPDAKTISATPTPINDPDYDALQDRADELDAVREAISALRDRPRGERYSVWQRTHAEGSAAFCAVIAPRYAAVASDYLRALIALGVAHVAHEDFMKARLAGVALESLRPLPLLDQLGDPREKTSPMRRLLAWAIETGRLGPDEIPAAWNHSK